MIFDKKNMTKNDKNPYFCFYTKNPLNNRLYKLRKSFSSRKITLILFVKTNVYSYLLKGSCKKGIFKTNFS